MLRHALQRQIDGLVDEPGPGRSAPFQATQAPRSEITSMAPLRAMLPLARASR